VSASDSGQISVHHEELMAHAGHVSGVADEVSKAASAALTISLNHDAFGLLLSFVGGWFQDKEHDLADKYSKTATDLHTDAGNLHTAAGRYEGSDRKSAQASNAAVAPQPRIKRPL
jgi:hypothetical protein